MDAARLIRLEDIEELQARQHLAFGTVPAERLENVVRLQPATQQDAAPPPPALGAVEIERAFDLVRDAARRLRASEDRVREAESGSRAFVLRAGEELRAAEARIQAADARTQLAEARALAAEARVEELESWLRRIYSTIADELPVEA